MSDERVIERLESAAKREEALHSQLAVALARAEKAEAEYATKCDGRAAVVDELRRELAEAERVLLEISEGRGTYYTVTAKARAYFEAKEHK